MSPVVGGVQSLSHVQLFATPWTAAHQASLSFTISWSLLCATWWPEFRQEYTYHAASAERGMDCTPKFSGVQLFATPWTAELQAFLSFPISQSLLKLKSIESVMPSNRLILCHHLLLLPSIFPSIRVFSNESALRIRWLKY